jgi:hypothetical protein
VKQYLKKQGKLGNKPTRWQDTKQSTPRGKIQNTTFIYGRGGATRRTGKPE